MNTNPVCGVGAKTSQAGGDGTFWNSLPAFVLRGWLDPLNQSNLQSWLPAVLNMPPSALKALYQSCKNKEEPHLKC